MAIPLRSIATGEGEKCQESCPGNRSYTQTARSSEDMERLTYEKILHDFEQFLQLCASIGLREDRGRFAQYRRAIIELMAAVKTRSLSRQDEKQLDKYHVA